MVISEWYVRVVIDVEKGYWINVISDCICWFFCYEGAGIFLKSLVELLMLEIFGVLIIELIVFNKNHELVINWCFSFKIFIR